jgi:hypothetical protein
LENNDADADAADGGRLFEAALPGFPKDCDDEDETRLLLLESRLLLLLSLVEVWKTT